MKQCFYWVLLFAYYLSACNNKQADKKARCLPGNVLVVYLGETNKPVNSLLISTAEDDSTYKNYVGGGKEKFDKYGFDTIEEILNKIILSEEAYYTIKKYLIDHKTKKNGSMTSNDQTSFKIILSDSCDKVMYSINKENKGFFQALIDTLELKNTDLLWSDLVHYQYIQDNRNPE